MSAGQVIVLIAIVAFFGYQVYALVRDILKKKEAKKELGGKNEKNKA